VLLKMISMPSLYHIAIQLAILQPEKPNIISMRRVLEHNQIAN
jgi:hypothetical protein